MIGAIQYAFELDASFTVAIALALGLIAFSVGRFSGIPGILVALALGMLFGPDGANLVRPATLGKGLEAIVGFCVSVILFEGALSLNPRRLRRTGKPVRRLVTVGALITIGGATLAAMLIMGWPPQLALVFGCLLVVTGPTVIAPLLRRLRAEKTVETVLAAEGVLGDAIGAVVAAVALRFSFEVWESPGDLIGDFALRMGVGIGVGGLFGLLVVLVGKKRALVPQGLERAVVLALVVLAFQLSNTLVGESGVVAAVACGLVAGALGTHDAEELREFKEELSTMMIGLLFILLAADVRLAELARIAPQAILVAATLSLVVRPIAVYVSTWRTGLTTKQALFVGWIGPRGIVAAALATLIAEHLVAHDHVREGSEFRGVVFITILFSCTLAGLTGRFVGKLLGLVALKNTGWIILGANPVAVAVAQALKGAGEQVVCIDKNAQVAEVVRQQGIEVVVGNGLEAATLARAGIERRRGAIALTPSEEVNYVFAENARTMAKSIDLYVGLQSSAGGIISKRLAAAHAKKLCGRGLDIGMLASLLATGRLKTERRPRPEKGVHEIKAGEVALLVERKGVLTPADGGNEKDADALILLVPAAEAALIAGASAGKSSRMSAVAESKAAAKQAAATSQALPAPPVSPDAPAPAANPS